MMVFVTAGTQLPFDRLIKTIDEIAGDFPDVTFIAQALDTSYQVKNIQLVEFVNSVDFEKYITDCALIISHAGMGTIFTALVNKKPIIVMPRLVKYNEHRNEHQLATCKQMDKMAYVHVAYDENELKNMFNEMWPDKLTIRNSSVTLEAPDKFLNALNQFIKF